jgi:hypothetical protein
MKSLYRTRARLWRYAGSKGSWHFLTLSPSVSREIRVVDAGPRRVGFGALRVQATIGRTTWHTSIFPSAQDHCYLLPVKLQVRKAENLIAGKLVPVQLEVRRAW